MNPRLHLEEGDSGRGARVDGGARPAVLIAGVLSIGAALALFPPVVAAAAIAVIAAIGFMLIGPTAAIMLAFAVVPLEIFVLDLGPIGLSPVQIVVLLAVVLFGIDALVKGRLEMPSTPLDVWVFLWLGSGFMGALFAFDAAATLKKAGLAVVFAVLFYVIAGRVRRTSTVTNIMRVFVAASTALGAYGVWVAVRYLLFGIHDPNAIIVGSEGLAVPRAGSTLGQPTVLAAMMVLALPIAVTLIMKEKGWGRIVAAVASGTILVTLGFTFTRGAWIGGVAGLAVLWLDRRARPILVALALSVLLMSPQIVFDRAASSANTSRKEISHRFDYWYGALLVGERNPLFGAGIDNFSHEYARLPVRETALRSAGHPHNLALTLFAETGVFGLVSFGGLIFGGLVLLFRRRRSDPDDDRRLWRLAIGASLIGTLTHQTTDSLLLEPTWNLVLWTMLGMAVAMNLGWCRGDDSCELVEGPAT